MAFTTAYPAFPAGNYTPLSPDISMGSQYIQAWLRCEDDDGDDNEELEATAARDMGHSWREFQRLVTFLPV